MPWYFPWPDYIKKKACRYLLQHYVGSFLEEKLTLDQLSVDLYSGTGTVKDVKLDVWALNELLESVSAPIEIRDGTVGSISVEIPWSALLTANSKVEIKGLKLTFQPKYRLNSDTNGSTSSSMADSMWSTMSMTSSMQLAQECLKRDTCEPDVDPAAASQPFEGPELLAQMIESVLTRVEMTFIDTIVRLEHVPHGCQSGIALELHIERLRYFDEGARSGPWDQGSSVDSSRVPHFEPVAIAHKNFQMMGVTVHCEEFPEDQRHGVRGTSFDSDPRDGMSDAFPSLAHSPEMPPQHNMIDRGVSQEECGGQAGWDLLDSCIIGECAGKQEVKVKVKQHEHVAGPKAEVETYLGSINLFLAPRHVHLLLELFNGFLSPATSDVTSTCSGQPNKPMQPEDFQRIETELQEHLTREKQQKQEDRLRRESWGLKDHDEEAYADLLTMQSFIDEDDVFFSMTSSMMSMSHTGTLDDMEASFTSTMSCSSTDTSRTGSSVTRIGYGNIYRGSGLQSYGSSAPKTTQPKRSKSRKGLREQLDDPTAELTRYKLRFSSLSLTILHNDPSRTPLNLSPTHTSSAGLRAGERFGKGCGRASLQERAKYFFQVLGKQGYGKKDQGEWKERFARACPYDHLRITAAPVMLECDRKTAPNVTAATADLSFGTLELLECLFDRPTSNSAENKDGFRVDVPSCQHIEILSFKEENSLESEYAAVKPSLGIRLKSIQRTSNQGSQRIIVHKPKSEIAVELGHLKCELDLTIVDRLYTLLHPQPVGRSSATMSSGPYRSLYGGAVNLNKQAVFNQALEETPAGLDQLLDIRVSCPVAHLAFRFPIPDLRDVSDCAWWKRSLRDEILHIELQDTEFRTILGDGKPFQTLLLQCRQIHSLLQMGPEESPVSFLRINYGNLDINSAERGFDCPKLVLKLYPHSETSVFEDTGESDSPPVNSWEGACHFEKPEVSPFSSKRVMYDSEQMVMPGDLDEMREFSDKAISNARIVMDLVIPSINILLPSKDFMELLYNRFGYDLLLWQPAAPTPKDYNDGFSSLGVPRLDLASHMAGVGMQDRFTMCQSGLYYDSDSDTEEDSSGFNSTLRQKTSQQTQAGNSQSFLALNLSINHGKLTMCTPFEDELYHGETMIEIEDGSLFTVSDYQGNANLSYLCVQANRFALYHNGQVDLALQNDPLPPATWATPNHLKCCLYLSDNGVATKLSGSVGNGAGSQNMLALALKMCFNPEINIKSMECAVGIRGATLQHYMTKPEHSWIVQLGEFFDVIDEEVLGYEMPSVVTEFHAHFWGCGIDYRPLYLPIRTFVMAETLSISSNLVYEAKQSLLRFLIDDASLYLSDQCNERSVDIRKNYVCILDLGMLELSLRISTEKEKNPKIDLKVSNNVVHLRTCADSCTALARLIHYLANDGDQSPAQQQASNQPEQQQQQQQQQQQWDMENEEHLEMNGKPPSDSPIGRGNHLDQMQQLMDEAMKDVRSGLSPPPSKGVPINIACTLKADGDLFLFPNEDNTDAVSSIDDASPNHQHHSLNSLAEPLSGYTDGMDNDDGEEYFNDDEFCVLDDPGMGILRNQGEPEVKSLDDTPTVIKEDHFARPLGRGDQLNAPPSFPTPVMKYTLQEMTIVWHVYGGHDFGPVSARKHSIPDVSSSPVRPGTPDRIRPVQTNTSSPTSRKSREQSHHQLSWHERGGPGRDHSTLMQLQMNKVRFQHTQYPEDTQQQSRQILLISDIEVRDRLANSQINKFLYLYSSEARPRRTHANMVLVKALHIRPDPNLTAEECCLRISLQPLRLNVDQDSLFFLHDFFTKVSTETSKVSRPETKEHLTHYATAPTKAQAATLVPRTQNSPPGTVEQWLADGMEEGEVETNGWRYDGEYGVIPNQQDLVSDVTLQSHKVPSLVAAAEVNPKGSGTPIFFKSFVFSPDVPIKLDYEGKRVDMEQGTLMGLLIGLGQLNHSELTLKRLHNRHGLLGIDKLILYAVNEWALDIKKTQLPSLLGGVGPMHSLVQLVQGLVDLVRLPMEQYKKDGRLMRGFQRGASSFGTSTAMAAVELTNRMVRILQTAAETAYDMVSPGPSVSSRAITYGPFGQSRLARQPTDFREGMANAFNVVREGLEDAAAAIVQVAKDEHEHKGVSGAVGGILRQIPPTVIKPLILASEATSSVLGGMRNQMLPDARKEDAEKWRSEQNK